MHGDLGQLHEVIARSWIAVEIINGGCDEGISYFVDTEVQCLFSVGIPSFLKITCSIFWICERAV